MTYKAWKREIERAAEKKNKVKILEDCQNKKRGEITYKTKTKSIIPLIEDPEFVRKPQSFMKENYKLIAPVLQCSSVLLTIVRAMVLNCVKNVV